MNYACSAAIGGVSGLRAMMGPAIISQAAGHRLVDVKRTPFAWLASERAGQISALLAGAELIADKLPFMKNRTDIGGLIPRFITGALCGAAVSGSHERNERIKAGLIGGAVAIAAAYAGFQYRKRVKMPKFAAAILEDTVAVGVGTAVVTAMCR